MKEEADLVLIKKALTLERARFQNYRNLSKEVLNIEGKEVLIKLAKAEKNHYRILKNQVKSIRKFNRVNPDVLENNEIRLLKKEVNFLKINSSLTHDIDIVRKAEKLEKKDPAFYEHLLGQTKNRKLKKVFQFLKKEESKHLRILKSKLKDLENLSSKLSLAKDPRAMFYSMVNR